MLSQRSCRVRAQPELPNPPMPDRRGELADARPCLLHELRPDMERRQVRLGKVPVVVGLFLGPQRVRLAGARIEAPRLLLSPSTAIQDRGLPRHLRVDGSPDEAKRIQVLEL